MPKIPQVVLSDGQGRGRRLMVKAKKGSKRATASLVVFDATAPNRTYTHISGEWVTKKLPVIGALVGTKKVPKDNAMKHPLTGRPQTTELLVQVGRNIASLPISEAELYWQKGEIRSGMRFVPDKEVKPPVDPQSVQPTT